MSDSHTHPVEALHDAIDGRLDPHERAALDRHLESCAACRREFDVLSRLKRQVGIGTRGVEIAPANLEDELRRVLDAEDRRGAERSGWAEHPNRRRLPWIAAAAAAVLAIALFLVGPRPEATPIPAEVAADFRRLTAGTLPLEVVTSDVAALEQRLATAGLGFTSRVFDFGMMDYRLTGGGRHRVAGTPSALFAYAGPGNLRLLCEMFRGLVSVLPTPVERRSNDDIEFLVYREGDITVVFWQEGEVMCALAADGDPEAAVRLAFAKAVRV